MNTFTRIAPATLIAALVACSPMHLEGPAPEGALGCALDLGLELGYEPVAGGTDSGFIRFERHELGSMSQTISVSHVNGTLRIQAAAHTDDGDALAPGGKTRSDAERILAECGA